ncbi:signal recognition particle-docking protein FtsY [Treponema phagedenis]|uniref:Signal recognition particle-docking protein FtsY n=1 Tax=Treponema phagedenis TaxID=162 RepID=A0A0B7GXF9_TREPH|nr:signal recognition particle-docking protein FtsY [Treponema phagedenis]EFW39393.1 signal recognition particle-docking protein FtsY [Treponema phagedenis F0421]NVP22990.1 signal recognition particle-docking protein FtsY [Treponema phagedenis]QEJ95112.1 signal recognition particle-docking protein FtsY [Treponema phagedenis]QEJ98214.1 signal recognition particle-docking protein FtsY [Treponema phagedenis]QEK01037.1 signal recognition particle-docking protein FtsY [Treponema phagedenis]
MTKRRFSEGLKRLFGMHINLDDSFFENLTDSLVEGDVGAKTAFDIETLLRQECKKQKAETKDDIIRILTGILTPLIKTVTFMPEEKKTSVYLILGVNGVGKTTSIAKIANYYNKILTMPIVLAAADTFRAAAIEQLQYHGKALGLRVVAHQHGGDPGAVVFDAAEAIKAQGGGLVLADTAGRLHTKENLIRELGKIDKIAESKADTGCYKKILVLDATTGQNAFRQAEAFHEAISIDAIMLTKYDSTAKGGNAITISKELNIPMLFIGTGEQYSDIAPFDTKEFIKEFIGRD